MKPRFPHALSYTAFVVYEQGAALRRYPGRGKRITGVRSAVVHSRHQAFSGARRAARRERVDGFPSGWTRPAEDSGFLRARWRLVGNAVSVPVAAWLGRRLMEPGIAAAGAKELEPGSSWPTAAFGENGRRWQAEISDRPVNSTVPDLSSFNETGWERLSERALRGFTTRARASTLQYPPGFLDALERQLNQPRHPTGS